MGHYITLEFTQVLRHTRNSTAQSSCSDIRYNVSYKLCFSRFFVDAVATYVLFPILMKVFFFGSFIFVVFSSFCEIHKGIVHAMLEGEKLHNADLWDQCIPTTYTSVFTTPYNI
jgi:hypothetical protein